MVMPKFTRKLTKTLSLIAVLLSISACNYLGGEDGVFRDRSNEYQQAQIVPQMRIPNELDSYTIDQLYVIPEQIIDESVAFEEVPMPRPIETRRREGVIIQSLSEKRWILIDATPGQVWPRIRDYWTELQIALDYENPSAGIMETAWVELGSDRENRHKYRIVIEPGLHSGYSEIYVVHLDNLRSDPIPTVVTWPEVSSSADLEQDMLRSVSQFLADRNDIYQASSASLLAGTIQAESKANIIEDAGGDPILELKVDYNRAWVQIRQALESAEIDIVDSNRDQSFFSVRFAGIVQDEESPGFFGRLLGRSDADEQEIKDFSVRLMETDSAINVVPEALEASTESNQLTLELLQVINDNLT
ncbi:MAG: outer membrane protein assembly factor BamC [Pseudomonadales bacterium]|nr:outer membrane protein assembly factor BamC [Pseudomonadales bacterium]